MVNVDTIHSISDERYKDSFYIYVLPIACLIAYYGDGKLNQKEFELLLLIADDLVVDDIEDREIVKKEVVLDILDSLKESIIQIKTVEERQQFAFDLTTEFASRANELLKKGAQSKLAARRESMIEVFERIAKADNHYDENEKELIKHVKKSFGMTWGMNETLGCGCLLLILWFVYWLVKMVWNWLFG